jgi:hypothetical protein
VREYAGYISAEIASILENIIFIVWFRLILKG